jgi:hypothetical protein
MTSEEAIQIAKQLAKERHWTWLGPGIARKGGWLLRLCYAWGKPVWEVSSHDGRGCQVCVVIKDATSRILHSRFEPR